MPVWGRLADHDDVANVHPSPPTPHPWPFTPHSTPRGPCQHSHAPNHMYTRTLVPTHPRHPHHTRASAELHQGMPECMFGVRLVKHGHARHHDMVHNAQPMAVPPPPPHPHPHPRPHPRPRPHPPTDPLNTGALPASFFPSEVSSTQAALTCLNSLLCETWRSHPS